MSTDSPPTAPLAAPAGPVVGFVVANRSAVAWALAVIGLACLGGAVYCGYKAFGTPATAKADADADKEKPKDETDKDKDKKDEVKLAVPYQTEYILGGLLGLMGTVVGLGVAASALARPERPDPAGRATDARWLILVAGGLFGLVLMVGGLAFAITYFGTLTKALDEGKRSELKWVVGPVVVLLLGAGLTFLAAQPARAEERNNPFLRRLIYGTNFALTTLLLVVVLLIANILVAVRLPNRLDTTAGGVHSLTLSEQTRDYLAGLAKTVQVYAILPDSDEPDVADTRRLLAAMQEVNPDRFVVRYLDPVLNRSDIKSLQNRYPQIPDLGEYGVLLVLQDNDKQVAFVRQSEMIKRDFDQATRSSRMSYEGEAKVARELLTLTEGKTQPTVYFTQSAGELRVLPNPNPMEPGEGRPAADLRTALERANCKVLAVPSDPNPAAEVKIPDDADVVVVADPDAPLAERTVQALRRYMTEPRPGGKKGRLVVLAGAHATSAADPSVLKIGIEPLLADFGITLRDRVLYASPSGRLPAEMVAAGVTRQQVEDRNPVALAFRGFRIPMTLCRPLQVARSGPAGGGAKPLFVTAGQRNTWVESTILPNPEKTWSDIVANAGPAVFRAKELADVDEPRYLAAVATDPEGATPRVVVYGCGELFTDSFGRQVKGIQGDLLTATVNYLRERPPLATIPPKKYNQYLAPPPEKADRARLYWLPLGVAVLGLLALGIGVWVFRQK